MKTLWIAVLGLAFALTAQAQVHVRGYYKKNGTYVAPYVRSSPNHSRLDNYSTRGNYNPYTGAAGTQSPYPAYPPPTYSPPAYRARPQTGYYQATEPSYGGNRCSSDCSGHEAGYEWAEAHGIDDPDNCGGSSQSFIEGCQTYADEQRQENEDDSSD